MRTFLLRAQSFRSSVALAIALLSSGFAAAQPPATEVAQPPATDVVSGMIAHAEAHPDGRAPFSFDASAFSEDVRQLPIGIFDSGIGGLTVMEAILALDTFDNDTLRPGADGRPDFENERFVYLGDQANMPYGNYDAAGKKDYLRELILKDVSFLLGRRYYSSAVASEPVFDKPPVKAIVIACNTATAYGLEDIRTAIDAWQLPVIVVGVVEAGAEEVVSTEGTVAVLATTGTCSSMAYPKAIGHAMGRAGKRVPNVIQHGSVNLAEAIEGDSDAADKYIRDDVLALLENYRRDGGDKPISSVILGCTHFPLVQDQIEAAFARLREFEEGGSQPYASLIAEEIRWIDPAELTAKSLFRELAKARLRRPAESSPPAEEDQLFLSVPDPAWPGIRLDPSGGLEHPYKYGRDVGQLEDEPTRYIPMTQAILPPSSLNLIRSRLPEVWTRIAAADRPNVVLVITDDQGYGDLGCHGNPILKTPHLDALYRQSIRLTDYHVSPTCSPTRAALQTGRWSNRTGVWHTIMGRSILRADEVTMGRIFTEAGYATGLFGKWHLGDNYPYRPEDRGYGEVLRHGGGGVGQTPDYWNNAYFDGSYFHNGEPKPVEGFCTDVWFEHAQDFIQSQRRGGKPFFACISTNAPHGPMHAPPEASAPYADQPSNVAHFFGMIANVDENVGRLRSFLDREGLSDNTIFIFTTDNGTAAGGKVFNAHMRGTKGSPYDGGHRVPLFIHWPAGNLSGPRDLDTLTAHVDVLPTLIDLCGIGAPRGVSFDGRSIRPLLKASDESIAGGTTPPWPERILVTDSQRVKDPIKWRQSSVMTERWRLINGDELYEIESDPGQQANVAGQHPRIVAELRSFYESWWSELKPSFAHNASIVLGHPDANPTTLTSHDWITTRLTPWNQGQIREAMAGPENTGFWNVEVVTAGEYEIRLRRWPREADAAIDSELPAGEDVPGDRAYRARPGQAVVVRKAKLEIAGQVAEQSVPSGARDAVFHVTLNPGQTRLAASFETDAGETIGAYYAYVEKR